jgi:thiamine-phosphate pyrophosphorylase
MRGIYPIIDTEALDRSQIDCMEFIRSVLAVRPNVLQLRAKRASARQMLELLRAILPLARRVGSKLYANDRPDLAKLAGADGVHLGQKDLPPEEVSRHFPELEIGLSTHTPAELSKALRFEPHYVAYGPVFSTESKLEPEPTVGLAGLERARALVADSCPLVAIGGINLSNAAAVGSSADLGAVIGELTRGAPDSDEVTERARRLHTYLGGTGAQ